MAQLFAIHPDNPQERLVKQVAGQVKQGKILVLPTDACYVLCCHLGDKTAMERILAIRQIDLKHHLTLLCADLSELGTYAKVDNSQFRLLKAATPGAYTFILPATKEVPNRTLHPKRKTIGLRVPDNAIALAVLRELGEPLLSCTLMLPEDEEPLTDPYEIQDRLDHAVDIIIDGGWCGSVCHGLPLQAWVWRRNAMPTAATHRLRGKKSSLHDAEAVQAPFNPL